MDISGNITLPYGNAYMVLDIKLFATQQMGEFKNLLPTVKDSINSARLLLKNSDKNIY